MLKWALEHDRMFCVALMRPGLTEAETVAQFFHVAGIGLISASVTQADGTSHLMLQGLSRVRFTGFSQQSPFRVAKIEALPEFKAHPAQTIALADALRQQCAAIRIDGAPLPESLTSVIVRIPDPGVLANTVAHSLVSDALQQQQLLEERDIAARLRRLAHILRETFPRK
jgi:ATP-dependent Lon protease